MNCYKIVLDSFPFCLFTYWVGSDAKFLDSCTPSDSENVRIYTWEPNPSSSTTYWYGGSVINSDGCWKVVSENTVPFNAYAINVIFGYMDFLFGTD